MSLIKKPYGLIYNTDGNLCVTLRDDDVPFPGVKTFAVEEGTENLRPLYKQQYALYGYSYTALTNGVTYTMSGSAKVNAEGKWFKAWIFKSDWTWGVSLTWDSNTNYEYKELTVTIPDDGGTYYFSFFAGPENSGCVADVEYFQLEQKPFATSFVDGTRADGKLTTLLNLNSNDSVISFWYKTNAKTITDNRIISFSDAVPTYDSDRFMIKTTSSDPTNATISLYNNNNLITEKNIGDLTTWRFFVITFNGNLCKIYIDGDKIFEYTHSLTNNALKYLNIPDSETSDFIDTLQLANLYFGKYDPNVWTPEYIKELYNARKPFAVPAKMPII